MCRLDFQRLQRATRVGDKLPGDGDSGAISVDLETSASGDVSAEGPELRATIEGSGGETESRETGELKVVRKRRFQNSPKTATTF